MFINKYSDPNEPTKSYNPKNRLKSTNQAR